MSEEERPPWAGAAGYVPQPDLPPHAPMPGAPPYPPAVDHPPAPVGRRARTRFRTALAASAVWGAVLVVLVPVVGGPLPDAASLALLVGSVLVAVLVTAVVVWAVARRRAWPFVVLVLLAAPVFAILRVLSQIGGAAS